MVTSPTLVPDRAHLPDAEVVLRVQGGERALFEVLMRRYNQRVYRTIRSILRVEAEAEDAMQQAWLGAWRKLGQLREGQAFGGWVTRIAANEALGRYRSSGPLESLPEEDMEPHDTRNPETYAATHELTRVVEEAVDRLPVTQRAAFMLRVVEGLSTEEAAAALGVSADALKVRLHRANVTLRAELDRAVELAPRAFRFEAPRCDPMVAWVMARIAEMP